jgi:hypothetical protein
MVVVSGCPCDLYRELYSDWASVRRCTRTQANRPSEEVLWLSPRAVARLAHRQLPLLEAVR